VASADVSASSQRPPTNVKLIFSKMLASRGKAQLLIHVPRRHCRRTRVLQQVPYTQQSEDFDRQYSDSRNRITVESRYEGETKARSSESLEVTNSAPFKKEGCSH
jgi:hypothetical protein